MYNIEVIKEYIDDDLNPYKPGENDELIKFLSSESNVSEEVVRNILTLHYAVYLHDIFIDSDHTVEF